jgi:RND superfamily putative drug exporter
MQQLASQLPGSSVLIGGGDLLSEDSNHAIQNDLTFAEELSIPITLVVLLFIFAGLIAASLPVLAALGTVLGGYAILMIYSAFAKLDGNAVTVVSLLGLALSIDYGLLIVARYREELARTPDRVEAVRRTWQTAGRTILFSGLTVAGALASLLAFDVDTLREMGVSAVATTLMAILAALTLTPALLGLAGDRLKPSAKQVARESAVRPGRAPDSGFFAGLARGTQKLPVVAILGCLVLLFLIASPVRNTVVKVPQLEALPTSLASVQVSDEMASQFGITSADPAVKVVARMSAADLQTYARGGAPTRR